MAVGLALGVALLALGTSAMNIRLSIRNAGIEERIKQSEQEIQKAKLNIEQEVAELERSKERTSRYTFVHTLFNDLVNRDDSNKKNLTINLVRLALTDEEELELFTNFITSGEAAGDARLTATGTDAIDAIKREQNSLPTN